MRSDDDSDADDARGEEHLDAHHDDDGYDGSMTMLMAQLMLFIDAGADAHDNDGGEDDR